MRLYYFTSLYFGLQSIRDKRLKIARFHELNDPFDHLALVLHDHDERHEHEKFKKELGDSNGLLCMSKTWSNPLLWGHYADKHKGLCLGFDVRNSDWSKVTYVEERPTLKTFGRKSWSDMSVDDWTQVSLMKFSA